MSAMFFFKRIIVVFWALWWMLAFLTDFLGGLYLLNVFTEPWVPHSNYPAVVTSLVQYDAPNWLPAVFFVGIIAWSLLSALAFIVAALTPAQPSQRWRERIIWCKAAFSYSPSWRFTFCQTINCTRSIFAHLHILTSDTEPLALDAPDFRGI